MKTLKSIGAVLAGLVAVFVLSGATDALLEGTGIMKQPFADNGTGFILLVVLYRQLYVAIGAYITAALAPDKPMKHAMILAGIGFVLGIVGAIVMWHLPPHWYPISLVVLGWPSAWIGARLRSRKAVAV
ncbi:hypothetical protein [Parachryseolinea silvisoli]|uniref:hypothetical protein n=1 Tax=Parachryseolinea silvisoli TaxID=2873601 RepID=UPI0022659CF7|nr:hypothetical protein [Parachryseolinea silvisoli]MCD9015419.1 hypothetical protein [Parachryseolinea silvisoli]